MGSLVLQECTVIPLVGRGGIQVWSRLEAGGHLVRTEKKAADYSLYHV
jgi:hypothetical protein